MKAIRSLAIILSFLLVISIININPTEAFVRANTAGSSDNVSLVKNQGPKKFGKKASSVKASVSKTGGSVTSAKARAIATRPKIKIGTRMKGKTSGDAEFTEGTATAFFTGIATFKANEKGATVNDFTITLDINGLLSCLSAAQNEGQSIASVEYLVSTVNRRNSAEVKDAGIASQDGLSGSPLQVSGGLVNVSKTSAANSTTFNGQRTINLGSLQDGDVLDFLFLGSSFLSWGPELAVENCASDFFNTNTFAIAKAEKQAKGKLKIKEAGKAVQVILIDADQTPSSGDERIILNDADVANIVGDSVEIRIFGPFGTVIEDVTLGAVGDLNADGIPDLELTSPQLPMVFASSSVNGTLVNGQITDIATSTPIIFAGVLQSAN